MATTQKCVECDGQVVLIGYEYVCSKCGLEQTEEFEYVQASFKKATLGSRDPELEKILGPKTQERLKEIRGEIKQARKYIVCSEYNKSECGKIRYYTTKKPSYCEKCARRKWNDDRARSDREKRHKKKHV